MVKPLPPLGWCPCQPGSCHCSPLESRSDTEYEGEGYDSDEETLVDEQETVLNVGGGMEHPETMDEQGTMEFENEEENHNNICDKESVSSFSPTVIELCGQLLARFDIKLQQPDEYLRGEIQKFGVRAIDIIYGVSYVKLLSICCLRFF